MNPLKKAVQPVNYYTSGTPVFRTLGQGGTEFGGYGTNAVRSFASVPDGSMAACKQESDTNTSATIDMNMKNVIRTGRLCLAVYNDLLDEAAATSFNLLSLIIRLDNDGTFAAPYMTRTVGLTLGWNTVMFGREIFATEVAGTPAFAEATSGMSDWGVGLIRFRAQIGGVANTKTRLYFAQLVDDVQCQSKIVLRFDDALASVYTTAFPIMQALGLKGVLGVISNSIGTAGYMTWAQVRELWNAGWEIANHTKTHLNNDYQQNEAYWLIEIQECQDAIYANIGVRPTCFISPYGNYLRRSAVDYRTVVENLFDVSMGTGSGHIGPQCMQGHYLPCHYVITHSGGVTVDGHLQRLKSTVAAGASSIMLFHNIVGGSTTADNDVTTATFTALMEQVFRYNTAGFANVVTIQEFQALGIAPVLL